MICEVLKEKVASNIAEYVTSVVVNRDTSITSFAVKKGVGNRAKVSIFIPPEISKVEHILIMSGDDVLADDVVNIPLTTEFDNMFSWQIEVNEE